MLASAALISGSAPAGAAAVTFDMTTFRSVVVDPTSGRVFASGDNKVSVFTASGSFVKDIAASGASGMTVEGADLWVAETGSSSIARIDLASLSVAQRYSTGVTVSGSVAFIGTQLWFTTPGTVSSNLQLATLDPITSAVQTRGGSFYGGRIEEIPGTTDRALVGDRGLSPYSVYKVNLTTNPVSTLGDVPHGAGSNLRDVVALPGGTSFVTAAGSPYRFDEFAVGNMTATGIQYQATHYPNAVAYSPAGSGVIVGGVQSSRKVYVFRQGTATASRVLDTIGDIQDTGVEVAPDASRVYAITAGSTSATKRLETFAVGPTINSITPSSVVAGVPAELTIDGTGFDSITNVTIGGTAASWTRISSTQLSVTVPTSLAPGVKQVQLTSSIGTASASIDVVPNTGAVLSGVVHAGSTPVPSVQLELSGSALSSPLVVTSGTDGSYAFPPVGYGTDYRLAAHDPAGAYHDWLSDPLSLVPNGGTVQDVALEAVPGPRISIGDVTLLEGNSSKQNATFAITLSEPRAADTLLTYVVVDGTASSSDDFRPPSKQTVRIRAGRTTGKISVPVWGDTTPEDDERFSIELVGADHPSVMLGRSTGFGTILDDDTAVPPGAGIPTVGIGSSTVVEGNTGKATVSFTLTLSAPQPVDTLVSVSVAPGGATPLVDYKPLPASKQVRIRAGRTTASIGVALYPDTVPEPEEAFDVMLTGSSNPAVVLGRATGAGVIVDDDGYDLPPEPPTSVTAVGGNGNATISWVEPLPNGGSPVLSYVVTSSPSGHTCSWSSGPFTCTIGGLQNGSTYTFTVVAVNAAGASPSSQPSGPTVPWDKPVGVLDSWGADWSGQLGNGRHTRPNPLPGGTTWSKVAAGGSHTLAVRTDGTLWAWGLNAEDQLGLGPPGSQSRSQPVQVGTDADWVDVSAGDFHSVAIRRDGSLWAWGRDWYGQLGTDDLNVPTRVGTETWLSARAGESHVVAVRSDGTLWAWGLNTNGQLGLGDRVNRSVPTQVGTASSWASVDAGRAHSLAIRADGTLWSWGRNSSGELGQGHTSERVSPVQVGTATWSSVSAGSTHSAALRADGTLWSWGAAPATGLAPTATLSPTRVGDQLWTAVDAGDLDTLAIRTDGSLWSWGSNSSAELGVGDTATRSSPTLVSDRRWAAVSSGSAHSMAIETDGTMFAWGTTADGRLGLPPIASPTTLDAGGDVEPVAAGDGTTFAIRPDGTLWAWGENQSGQLGVGDYTDRHYPTQVGSSTGWRAVSAGYSHTLAIREDGTLWGWGSNGAFALGLEPHLSYPVPTQIGTAGGWRQAVAGSLHTAALREDGTLWSWGMNTYGQLGVGDKTDRKSPTQVGTASTWKQIRAGGSKTGAIRSDGTLWMWGWNGNGELGLGHTTDITTPALVSPGATWSSLSLGRYHSLGVRTDGSLWAWGHNGWGQLGLGDVVGRTTPTRVGTATDWRELAGGVSHTVGLRAGGSIWTWGSNDLGQLGHGDVTTRNTPTRVGLETHWVRVFAGSSHTLAMRRA